MNSQHERHGQHGRMYLTYLAHIYNFLFLLMKTVCIFFVLVFFFLNSGRVSVLIIITRVSTMTE